MLNLEMADIEPAFETNITQELSFNVLSDQSDGFLFLLKTNIIVKVSQILSLCLSSNHMTVWGKYMS